ncbi:Uma2 family endonuclease [Leptolyngbya sp. FACHB-17]|uniref:Uma2 family endonuclease n=1 Tax=unclassified Leptolyngbya TaxID=2650499 RepID=UPI001681529E|nr:Uma2 family endonuclease [Leptolyngbya sp. FACHB-17]MBD2081519.1 Uma2 family endonuclease [Leptolyngbya sp. FACHB-17]
MVLQQSKQQSVPPLASGDRLTRAEFERRYAATPENFKAELIEGVVYVASPVRAFHGDPHFNLIAWLSTYSIATPGTQGSDNTTTRLDLDNEPQPDVSLRIVRGGTTRVSEDGYIEGAPELVAEIATSSAAIDLGAKMNAYRRNRVQEYLVWQTFENQLSWFRLENEQYVLVELNESGIIQSQVFPGLWLEVAALLNGEMFTVMNTLQLGLQSPEHQIFVQELAERS